MAHMSQISEGCLQREQKEGAMPERARCTGGLERHASLQATAAMAAAEHGQLREVLGRVEPGESLPLPYAWQSSGTFHTAAALMQPGGPSLQQHFRLHTLHLEGEGDGSRMDTGWPCKQRKVYRQQRTGGVY